MIRRSFLKWLGLAVVAPAVIFEENVRQTVRVDHRAKLLWVLEQPVRLTGLEIYHARAVQEATVMERTTDNIFHLKDGWDLGNPEMIHECTITTENGYHYSSRVTIGTCPA